MLDTEKGDFEKALSIFWARWRSGQQPNQNDQAAWFTAMYQFDLRVVFKTFQRLYTTHDPKWMPTCNEAVKVAESIVKSEQYYRDNRCDPRHAALPPPPENKPPADPKSDPGWKARIEMEDLMANQQTAGTDRDTAFKQRIALCLKVVDRSETLNYRMRA